jgi:hypothetical protein
MQLIVDISKSKKHILKSARKSFVERKLKDIPTGLHTLTLIAGAENTTVSIALIEGKNTLGIAGRRQYG